MLPSVPETPPGGKGLPSVPETPPRGTLGPESEDFQASSRIPSVERLTFQRLLPLAAINLTEDPMFVKRAAVPTLLGSAVPHSSDSGATF